MPWHGSDVILAALYDKRPESARQFLMVKHMLSDLLPEPDLSVSRASGWIIADWGRHSDDPDSGHLRVRFAPDGRLPYTITGTWSVGKLAELIEVVEKKHKRWHKQEAI